MAVEKYDLIFVDDEMGITVLFNTVVQMQFPQLVYTSFNDSEAVYEMVNQKLIQSKVWILDIMMPRRNGVEIADLIRQVDPEAIIIGYTALDPVSLKLDYGPKASAFKNILSKSASVFEVISLTTVWITPQHS
jgi:DNA-binding NtrC family response regulator